MFYCNISFDTILKKLQEKLNEYVLDKHSK